METIELTEPQELKGLKLEFANYPDAWDIRVELEKLYGTEKYKFYISGGWEEEDPFELYSMSLGEDVRWGG